MYYLYYVYSVSTNFLAYILNLFTYLFYALLVIIMQLESTPVLILGNKIDMPGAVSEEEMKKFFGLEGRTTGKGKWPWRKPRPDQPLEVFMCSILKKQGYGEAFRWLGQFI